MQKEKVKMLGGGVGGGGVVLGCYQITMLHMSGISIHQFKQSETPQ